MPRKPALAPSVVTPPELQDLSEQIAEFIEYWGFKRVHGRLWTHLFLSDHPMDAAEFIQRLGISKALVSMTISDLLEYEVILPAGKSERGTELFIANPDTTSVILNVLRRREKRMLSRIDAAYRLFKTIPARDKKSLSLITERVEALGTLIQSGQDSIEGIITLSGLELATWRELSTLLRPQDTD
jgi:DNA-binding transcriptional regulator GbsR (MarR family)